MAVFRHLTQDELKDADAQPQCRFKYSQSLHSNQISLRIVKTLRPGEDASEQWKDFFGGGNREVPVARGLRRRLLRMARALGTSRKRKEGDVLLKIGQIRWDGKSQAIVQAYSQYHFDDKSQGDYGWGSGMGWSYRLQKLHGGWRVLGRHRNFAAG